MMAGHRAQRGTGPAGRRSSVRAAGRRCTLLPMPSGLPEAPPPPPPARERGPIRVGGQISPPQLVRRVEPDYPKFAVDARLQGVVILEATIGTDGKVKDVKVLRSIPLLDQAAIDAVRQWEYTPTMLNNVPVPVIMTVTVNFTLQ